MREASRPPFIEPSRGTGYIRPRKGRPMATRSAKIEPMDADAEMRSLIVQLAESLKAEHAAHERLMETIRRVEREGQRQRQILGAL